jgi:hypothetical protein
MRSSRLVAILLSSWATPRLTSVVRKTSTRDISGNWTQLGKVKMWFAFHPGRIVPESRATLRQSGVEEWPTSR